MANHKSAIKAHAQSLARGERNSRQKSRMRRAIRAARAGIGGAASGDDLAQARDTVRNTVALIDRLAGKGVIHRNAAARHKSRLAKRLQNVATTD